MFLVRRTKRRTPRVNDLFLTRFFLCRSMAIIVFSFEQMPPAGRFLFRSRRPTRPPCGDIGPWPTSPPRDEPQSLGSPNPLKGDLEGVAKRAPGWGRRKYPEGTLNSLPLLARLPPVQPFGLRLSACCRMPRPGIRPRQHFLAQWAGAGSGRLPRRARSWGES